MTTKEKIKYIIDNDLIGEKAWFVDGQNVFKGKLYGVTMDIEGECFLDEYGVAYDDIKIED